MKNHKKYYVQYLCNTCDISYDTNISNINSLEKAERLDYCGHWSYLLNFQGVLIKNSDGKHQGRVRKNHPIYKKARRKFKKMNDKRAKLIWILSNSR